MKKLLRATLVSAFLSLPMGQAAANDSIDVRYLSCEELLSIDDTEALGIIIFWLDGYLSGVTNDTRLNFSNLERFGERLGEACAKSPGAMVLDISRVVGIN